MSKEEEDLREFVRVLKELTQEAKTPFDLNVKLLSDASARLEDRSAKMTVELMETANHKNQGTSSRVIRYLTMQLESLRFGPPLSDPLVRVIVDGLVKTERINIKQRRLINLYQMIRFQVSGRTEIQLPSDKCYKLATVAIAILFILLLLSAGTVWEIASMISGGLLIAYSLGSLIGYLLRAAYDSAWGREKLAIYVRNVVPWLCVSRNE